MGFQIETATGETNSVPCVLNYELKGANRVLFVRSLAENPDRL
jgi:hypothetical protein